MTDENEIETEEAETESPEVEEPSKPESAQETAKAVWDELKEKADQEEAEAPKEEAAPDKTPDEISDAAKKLAGAKKKKRQTFVPAGEETVAEKYEPPQNWDVKDKEAFLTLPPIAQKNALQQFKNWQGQTTKIWQDLSRERDQAKEVNQVLENHWKDLDIPSHFTKGQVVDQLLQYQKRINNDSTGAILEMMGHRGVTFEDLQARASGQAPAPQRQQQQQPQNNYLTKEELLATLEQRDQYLTQSRSVDAATEEVKSLAREMQNGKYTWPEMHSAADIQRIQPLVTYHREMTPGASWAEVYKKAIAQDRSNRGIGNPSPAIPRLTSENIQTVRQASSSLRSRGGNGAIPRLADPKPNETARESAEAAYYAVFGDKQH